MTVLDTPEQIDFYLLCARKGALRLEIHGLKHSSGKSVYALCKRTYHLKGSKLSVLAQLEELVAQQLLLAASLRALETPPEPGDQQAQNQPRQQPQPEIHE